MRCLAQQMNPKNSALGQREVIRLIDAGERLSQHFGQDLSSWLPQNETGHAFPGTRRTQQLREDEA